MAIASSVALRLGRPYHLDARGLQGPAARLVRRYHRLALADVAEAALLVADDDQGALGDDHCDRLQPEKAGGDPNGAGLALDRIYPAPRFARHRGSAQDRDDLAPAK